MVKHTNNMKREDISFVLFDQQRQFNEEKPIIKRELSKRALELIKLNLPLVITGVRRCGKSYLLKIIKDELRLKEKEYLYINFNDERFIDFSVEDFQKIIDFLNEQKYNEKCFLFIDEIQEVDNWEKWIDRIKESYKIVITGSNSKLLSSEISTILTGRSLSLMLTPLNFREFLGAKKISIENWKMDLKKQAEIRSLFKDYLVNGGFPKHVLTGENIIIKELYEQILYRDIIERFSKSRTKVIKEISVSLLSNPSSLVSMRQISATTHIKNLGSVKSILDAFESSFLFFFVNKFDFSVKKQTQNPRKVYCIDNGFPVALGFRLSDDMGKLIENLTAVELKRKGKEVFYHSDKNECDFVIREGNKIAEAIQVCYNLTEDNKGRETKGLIEVMERFKLKEGLILTYDQTDEFKIGTIRIKVLPVWKWLLDDKKFD